MWQGIHHLVLGAGIWTHNLSNISLITYQLDQFNVGLCLFYTKLLF